MERKRTYIPDGADTLIFDIGNVLLRYDWESLLDSFSFAPEVRQKIASAVFLNADWERGDKGGITPEEWRELFVENAPELKEEICRVYGKLEGTIRPFPYTKELVRTLKERGYQLYYLSNYSQYLLQETEKYMDFLEEFDGGIFSYTVQCIKPDSEIYRILLKRYGIVPERAVFFDDRPDNVEAAERLGIHGIVFTPEVARGLMEEENKNTEVSDR